MSPLLRASAVFALLLPLAAQADDSSCGRISTFHVMPRTQKLFSAKLLEIDGKLAGYASQDAYKLPPGHHRLTVSEQIAPSEFLGMAEHNRSLGNAKPLTLDVDVQVGTTYLLAAKLLDNGSDAVAANRYWQPVIWKQLAESCH